MANIIDFEHIRANKAEAKDRQGISIVEEYSIGAAYLVLDVHTQLRFMTACNNDFFKSLAGAREITIAGFISVATMVFEGILPPFGFQKLSVAQDVSDGDPWYSLDFTQYDMNVIDETLATQNADDSRLYTITICMCDAKDTDRSLAAAAYNTESLRIDTTGLSDHMVKTIRGLLWNMSSLTYANAGRSFFNETKSNFVCVIPSSATKSIMIAFDANGRISKTLARQGH